MEKEKIERAAIELCTTEGQEEWVKGYGVSCFKDGARWRIDSVWHNREERPEVGKWFIFKADDTNPFTKQTIKKIAYYTNRIENDEGLDWLKMVAEYKILCWAYVDDLLPDGGKEGEMIDSIPNPLADKGVQKDIKEKVDELMSRPLTSYNEGVADTIRRLVESAAKWGMSEGFRMGWRVHEVTEGGRI